MNNPVPGSDSEPLTRSEHITVLAHFYRAEMHRATVWRMRLDTTTNWSLISVMGLLSFVMANNDQSPMVIVVGMLLVFNFLIIESRRFRFFDVWRWRVRMLELNLVGPSLHRNPLAPVENWESKVAGDLMHPRYKLSWNEALRVRLTRNYLPMFGLLLAIWISEVDWMILLNNQGTIDKKLSSWLSAAIVVLLYGYFIWIIAMVKQPQSDNENTWKETLHEIGGLDR
jgi:uncharacterized membrane protein